MLLKDLFNRRSSLRFLQHHRSFLLLESDPIRIHHTASPSSAPCGLFPEGADFGRLHLFLGSLGLITDGPSWRWSLRRLGVNRRTIPTCSRFWHVGIVLGGPRRGVTPLTEQVMKEYLGLDQTIEIFLRNKGGETPGAGVGTAA